MKQYRLHMEADFHRKVKTFASEQGVSIKDLIERGLEYQLTSGVVLPSGGDAGGGDAGGGEIRGGDLEG